MRCVLDASVAVAAVRPAEASHLAARARVDLVLRGMDTLILPAIFVPEVAATLGRAGWDEASVGRYLAALTGPPTEVVTIGARRALAIGQTAVRLRLRGADACYAWLAAREGVVLVTLDAEMLTRAAVACSAQGP